MFLQSPKGMLLFIVLPLIILFGSDYIIQAFKPKYLNMKMDKHQIQSCLTEINGNEHSKQKRGKEYEIK